MTGIPAVDIIVIWAGVLGVMTGGVAVLWRATRSLRRLGTAAEDFIDDWRGTAGRPGVPARPGVMERLDAIERDSRTVAHEVRPNGGSSLRDAVDRVDERTRALDPEI